MAIVSQNGNGLQAYWKKTSAKNNNTQVENVKTYTICAWMLLLCEKNAHRHFGALGLVLENKKK